jgi:hypothetical protein
MKLEFFIGLISLVLGEVQVERSHSFLFVEEMPTLISYKFTN